MEPRRRARPPPRTPRRPTGRRGPRCAGARAAARAGAGRRAAARRRRRRASAGARCASCSGLVVAVEGDLEHRGASAGRAHRLGQGGVAVHRRPVGASCHSSTTSAASRGSRSSQAAQSGPSRRWASRPGGMGSGMPATLGLGAWPHPATSSPPPCPPRSRAPWDRSSRGPTRCCDPASTPTCRPTPPWPWPSGSAPSPRDVAARIVAELDDLPARVEISGPGFLNITYDDAWITSLLAELAADPRLGVPTQPAQVVPIDYSAPNVAKEMHVGHLRTTVVGDALARTLEHLGHRVVRQNHIGDWGTPFGMLIEHLLAVGEDSGRGAAAGERPQRLLPGGARAVRRRRGVRDPGPGAGGRAAGRRRGDAAAVDRAGRAVAPLLQPDLHHARRDPHRRRPGGRVDVQRRPGRDLRRARGGGPGDDERRRAVRLPRRLHRARGQAASR